MGCRLSVALNVERQNLRGTVETISGIADDTSCSIAERMPSERAIAEAAREESEGIPNVGENRAALLKERVGW